MKFAWMIPVVAGAAWFVFPVSRAEKAPEQAKSVSVAELNQLQVIGWLGQPLGKVVTVEGVVADATFERSKAQVGQTLLLIQAVDGKQLPERVVYCFDGAVRDIEEPKAGSRFKYIGYETGGFTGKPARAYDYLPSHNITSCSAGFYFRTEFVILRDELKPRKEPELGGKNTPPPSPPKLPDEKGKAPLPPESDGKYKYTPPAE
jgi:hypothetical protein